MTVRILSTVAAPSGGSVGISGGANLVFDSSSSQTASNAISGAGSLIKRGTGTLVLTEEWTRSFPAREAPGVELALQAETFPVRVEESYVVVEM